MELNYNMCLSWKSTVASIKLPIRRDQYSNVCNIRYKTIGAATHERIAASCEAIRAGHGRTAISSSACRVDRKYSS